MRRYETIFVLRPDLGEAALRQAIKRIEDVVGHGGGEMVETEEWGVRELAYRVKRERRGYYVRLDYVAPAAALHEVERNLKLMDDVLRYLSVLVAEEANAAELRGEIEARQHRLAEARAAAAAAAQAASAGEQPSPSAPESGASAQEAAAPDSEAGGGEA